MTHLPLCLLAATPLVLPLGAQAQVAGSAAASLTLTEWLQPGTDQLQRDVQVADGKLAELQNASVALWKDLQAALSDAVARLRSGPDSAVLG